MSQPDNELAVALARLDPETRGALGRALEREEFEIEGGDWGSSGAGAGCLLSLAAWELGLERGEVLMERSPDAVRIPALFDAWWSDLLARDGDRWRVRRTAREAITAMLAGEWTAERELAERARIVAEASEPAHVAAAPVRERRFLADVLTHR